MNEFKDELRLVGEQSNERTGSHCRRQQGVQDRLPDRRTSHLRQEDGARRIQGNGQHQAL